MIPALAIALTTSSAPSAAQLERALRNCTAAADTCSARLTAATTCPELEHASIVEPGPSLVELVGYTAGALVLVAGGVVLGFALGSAGK